MGDDIVLRDEARADLVDAFEAIGRYSPDAARRFLAEADRTFRRLALTPGIGERFESPRPDLADVRRSTVSRFKQRVVYYRPTEGGIEVLRVLLGGRDADRVFDADEGEAP